MGLAREAGEEEDHLFSRHNSVRFARFELVEHPEYGLSRKQKEKKGKSKGRRGYCEDSESRESGELQRITGTFGSVSFLALLDQTFFLF